MSGVEYTEQPELPEASYQRDADGFKIPEVPARERKRVPSKKTLVPPEEVPKPKHAPPKKLVVEPGQTPIWQALMNTQAPISYGQWIKVDKNAMRDLQDGIRYLKQRKVNTGTKEDQDPSPKALHAVEGMVDSLFEGDTDDEDFVGSDVSECGDTEVATLTSVNHKPEGYEPKAKFVRQIKILVTIFGQRILATVDSAACLCVISDVLAKKLNLEYDATYACDVELANAQLEKTLGMCPNLPLRVGDVLLPGDFHVVHRPDDYLILGLTWLGEHDVDTSHGQRVVKIPQYDIIVESEDHVATTLEIPRVYEVMVREQGGQENPADETEEVQSPEVQKLVAEFADCFVENNPLGVIHNAVHHIETKDETPITSRPYRMSWKEQQQLKLELDHLLEADLIRPSDGTWTSPVLFVAKKDGSLRF